LSSIQKHLNKILKIHVLDLRNREIQRVLEAAAQEQKDDMDEQMNELKRSWNDQMNLRANEKAGTKVLDYDTTDCGISSAQRFFGEDLSQPDRIKAQQDQMRNWIQEQMAEKAYRRSQAKQEDDNYAQLLRLTNEFRAAQEKEENDLRRKNLKDILAENRQVNLQVYNKSFYMRDLR
jgi:hypothetical protein